MVGCVTMSALTRLFDLISCLFDTATRFQLGLNQQLTGVRRVSLSTKCQRNPLRAGFVWFARFAWFLVIEWRASRQPSCDWLRAAFELVCICYLFIYFFMGFGRNDDRGLYPRVYANEGGWLKCLLLGLHRVQCGYDGSVSIEMEIEVPGAIFGSVSFKVARRAGSWLHQRIPENLWESPRIPENPWLLITANMEGLTALREFARMLEDARWLFDALEDPRRFLDDL